MGLKPPEKISIPYVVFGPEFGKSVIKQTFRNQRTGEPLDFICFDYRNRSRFALVFALTNDNEVVAIKQYRYGAEEILLELPGGIVNRVKILLMPRLGSSRRKQDSFPAR